MKVAEAGHHESYTSSTIIKTFPISVLNFVFFNAEPNDNDPLDSGGSAAAGALAQWLVRTIIMDHRD